MSNSKKMTSEEYMTIMTLVGCLIRAEAGSTGVLENDFLDALEENGLTEAESVQAINSLTERELIIFQRPEGVKITPGQTKEGWLYNLTNEGHQFHPAWKGFQDLPEEKEANTPI
jgi:hypothetical protein